MLASRILELRNERNMSQEKFAEFCGISRSSLARYEKGDPISRDCLIRIATACNVSLDEILPTKKTAQQTLDGQISEFVNLASQLTPENQEKLRSYLLFLLEREQIDKPTLPADQ